MTRTNNLPPPTTILEAAEVCMRNSRHALMNIIDCADCQDCSDAEIDIYKRQSALWAELAEDLHAMHKRDEAAFSAIVRLNNQEG